MKKLWVNLLAVLLLAAIAVTCALAETDEGILLGDAPEVVVPVETADGLIIEDEGVPFDIAGLPSLGENDITLPDISLEDVEADAVPAREAAASNAGDEDFEIINGILVKYKGEGGDVVIPDGVTAIAQEAFHMRSSITSVTIPNSVTSIGNSAFRYCRELTGITIPNSVTSIGEQAFEFCYSLVDVTIPDSVTSIGNYAFSYTSLTSVTIPNSVTSIGSSLFYECSDLASITIQEGVTSIGYEMFLGCSSLTSVTIPNSVTSIGDTAFGRCSNLTSVTIPNSVTSIGDYAFRFCTNLTSVSIGSGLTYIGSRVFADCIYLKSIKLPLNITLLGESAFSNCYSLMDVTLSNGAMDISDDAFSGCPVAMTFHTPCDSTTTKWAEGKGYKVVKSDHTPVVTPAVAPTCSETGLTEGSHCSVCGKVLVRQKKIPKLISIKKCTITGIKDVVYTGKTIKPATVVKYKGKKLVEDTDYTVKYAKNKAVGKATVTITGIGKYGASVNKSFKISPRAVALIGLTAGKQQLVVKWKKDTSITGYEVQYGLKKSFAGATTITLKKSATKTVLKKLTTGKKYYVRIRAFKTVNGKKYYSAWSKAKSAKVK